MPRLPGLGRARQPVAGGRHSHLRRAPLCLDTREQMVASIISKKLAAGSTHLLIDLPVGPTAKLANASEAMRLRKLFEFVGDQFGIAVEVITTDGRQPIGNGIGPVLEASDVMAVLTNEPDAPADLREKSLRLAAHLLEYDPQLRGGAGYARPRVARQRRSPEEMQEIIDAQGPRVQPQRYRQADLRRPCRRRWRHFRNRPAATEPPGANRRAPIDKGAGIKLFCKIGDRVEKGQPLYRIHAYDQSELDLAVTAATRNSGYVIGAQQPLPVETTL